MPRKFHHSLVTCPGCGAEFDTDDATDAKPEYKTDPSTSRTDGDDPDNTGADEDVSKLNNSMTNKPTPQDILTKALVATAKNAEPASKPAPKAAPAPMRNQSVTDILTKAMAEARAKLIRS